MSLKLAGLYHGRIRICACLYSRHYVKSEAMEQRPQALIKMSAVLSAAVLLFVVLFPYTPTPIALSISKILIAVTVLPAGMLFARMLTLSIGAYACPKCMKRLFSSDEILDLICLRLQ